MKTDHAWIARWLTPDVRDEFGKLIRPGGERVENCACGAVYPLGGSCPAANG